MTLPNKHDAECLRRKIDFPYLCTCRLTDAEVAKAREGANPHSRAKSDLTGAVELVDTPNRAGGAANAPAHGIGTEVQMHDDPTSPPRRKTYYLSGYVAIDAVDDDEAVRKFEEAGLGPHEQLADDVTLSFEGPWDEIDEAMEATDEDCICPPGLVARGGFKGGCPVHD